MKRFLSFTIIAIALALAFTPADAKKRHNVARSGSNISWLYGTWVRDFGVITYRDRAISEFVTGPLKHKVVIDRNYLTFSVTTKDGTETTRSRYRIKGNKIECYGYNDYWGTYKWDVSHSINRATKTLLSSGGDEEYIKIR